MNNPEVFCHDRFLDLSGSDLVDYVEPFLTAGHGTFPEDVFDKILNQLAELDSEHTVYALEIGMLHRSEGFVRRIAQFLSDRDRSVCSTAHRLIKSMPLASIPRNLVAQIMATPRRDLFTPDVRTGQLVLIGTNEELARDLARSFADSTRNTESRVRAAEGPDLDHAAATRLKGYPKI